MGGDQNTEFSADDGLPTVIPIGLGLGIAGMPYFGSDIAGYQTPPGHPDSTKELFFRWTELGALSPVMRTHHGVAPALEWSFQRDAETLAHYGRWARIHLKLYPYLHAAAAEAAQAGAPLMRALALGFPDRQSGLERDRRVPARPVAFGRAGHDHGGDFAQRLFSGGPLAAALRRALRRAGGELRSCSRSTGRAIRWWARR